MHELKQPLGGVHRKKGVSKGRWVIYWWWQEYPKASGN